MLVNIPANRKRVVAVSFPRDLAITPMQCEPWNPETHEYGPLYDDETKSYGPDEVYTETKLNSAYAFGGPKCLVKVIQKTVRPVRKPIHGSRFRRVLQDGRRPRRCRGVQHHAAGGLRARHRAGQRRTPDGRRAHRAAVRARAAGDHRSQRRLRPDQAPAAVPVVAAALDDLQGMFFSLSASSTTWSTCSSTTATSTTSRPRISSTSASRFRACPRAGSRSSRCRRLDTPTQYGNETPRTTTCARCSTRSSTTTRCPRRTNAEQHPGARHAENHRDPRSTPATRPRTTETAVPSSRWSTR